MDFEPKCVSRNMNCVSTVTFSVRVNGFISEKFSVSWGLRQGDPLSPYLFLLCIQGFSSLLHAEAAFANLHGIQISRKSPPISHLFFADDNLVFF